MVGVFDGHGGPETADFVSVHLPIRLLRDESFEGDVEEALREAFLLTNERYFEHQAREAANDNVGSTAVLGLFRENNLWIAWAGDSEAALYRTNGERIKCCITHKPGNEKEKQRIEEMGGFVKERGGIMRVCGALAVARAFGDGRYRQYITCNPDIQKYELQGNEEFLVVACDGLWDVMTVDDVGEFLESYRGRRKEGMVDTLVHKARALGSTDNITAIVVTFNQE